jgi:UDP-N-acetylmuramoylalanine--D-glutamate ligase
VLNAGGKRAVAAGNIGIPFCEVVPQSEQLDAVVLEVSSFQLETVEKFRPQVSVMMNITPDHLDRYKSMRDYVLAKALIYCNQTETDFAIINADTVSQLREAGVEIAARQVTFSSTGQKADLWLENGVIHGRRGYLRGKTLAVTDTKLRGPHNAENVMAALAVGSVFAVPRETMVAALRAYQPQPHRMEFVAEINGVTFINDSKATNVDAVGKALQTFTAPVVLIAGGKDKGFDFDSIKPLLKTKVRAAVLVGETRQKIAKSWRDTVPCMQAKTFRDAVWQAATAAQPGDIVLLGPACSSFDMFKNYADRGDTFKQLVNEFAISPEAKAGRRPTASGESVKENTPLPIGANR